MLAMALDAMDKVLNNLLVHFVAQDGVVLNFDKIYKEAHYVLA